MEDAVIYIGHGQKIGAIQKPEMPKITSSFYNNYASRY